MKDREAKRSKLEPRSEHSKPETRDERFKSESKQEHSKAESKEERSRPMPKEERSKPVPKEERSKPVPKKERFKPVPKEEHKKERVSDTKSKEESAASKVLVKKQKDKKEDKEDKLKPEHSDHKLKVKASIPVVKKVSSKVPDDSKVRDKPEICSLNIPSKDDKISKKTGEVLSKLEKNREHDARKSKQTDIIKRSKKVELTAAVADIPKLAIPEEPSTKTPNEPKQETPDVLQESPLLILKAKEESQNDVQKPGKEMQPSAEDVRPTDTMDKEKHRVAKEPTKVKVSKSSSGSKIAKRRPTVVEVKRKSLDTEPCTNDSALDEAILMANLEDEEETILKANLPEVSKWERDNHSDSDDELAQRKRRGRMEDKKPLPK